MVRIVVVSAALLLHLALTWSMIKGKRLSAVHSALGSSARSSH